MVTKKKFFFFVTPFSKNRWWETTPIYMCMIFNKKFFQYVTAPRPLFLTPQKTCLLKPIYKPKKFLGVFLKISTDDQGHSNQPFVGILWATKRHTLGIRHLCCKMKIKSYKLLCIIDFRVQKKKENEVPILFEKNSTKIRFCIGRLILERSGKSIFNIF